MIGKRAIAIAVVVVAVITGAFFIYRGRQSGGGDDSRQRIAPEYGSIRSVISTSGTVQPRNRLEIKPPVNGRIESILVVEGRLVRKGQTLALMSSTERAAFIDVARTQDAATLKYWEDAYKPIPLIAPIGGTVIVRAVEPGQTVTTATAVLVLSDRLIVKAEIDETDIGRVRLGQSAAIQLDAHPDIRAQGRVSHISFESKTINNVTMYEVEVVPEKISAEFRSGMSANISIIERVRDRALLLPLEAVTIDENGSSVLVATEGTKPQRRAVTTGLSDDRNVEIVSGLSIDDRVALPEKKRAAKQAPARGGTPFLPSRPRR